LWKWRFQSLLKSHLQEVTKPTFWTQVHQIPKPANYPFANSIFPLPSPSYIFFLPVHLFFIWDPFPSFLNLGTCCQY
jgi:hypothetical protein